MDPVRPFSRSIFDQKLLFSLTSSVFSSAYLNHRIESSIVDANRKD